MRLYKCGCLFVDYDIRTGGAHSNKVYGCRFHPRYTEGTPQAQAADLVYTNEVPRAKPATHREMLLSDAARAIKELHPDRAEEMIRELDIERVLTALITGEDYAKKIAESERHVADIRREAEEMRRDRERMRQERDALQVKIIKIQHPAIQKPKKRWRGSGAG